MSTKMEWIIALKAELPVREKLDKVENGLRIPSGLTPDTKLILTYLHTYAKPVEGGLCAWPTISRLSDETGKTRETIRKHLERAEQLGWLRGESWGNDENPLRRWYLLIPEGRNPLSRRQVNDLPTVNHPAQPLITSGQPLVRGDEQLSRGDERLATEKVIEKVIEKGEEKAAATHTPASAPAHEGQPAAADGQDFDLGQPDQGRQAASRKPTQTSTAQHGELSAWLVGELKARKAELVRTDAPATPSQVKVCVAAVVALAAGDEGAARRYIEDRLTGFALRGEGRPKSLAVLLGFLVDRGDYAAWERERHEASAQHSSMRRPAHSGSGHYNDPAMKALADIIVM